MIRSSGTLCGRGQTTRSCSRLVPSRTGKNSLITPRLHKIAKRFLSNPRFEAKYLEVQGSRVRATLLIRQASYDDLMNYCYLEAVNELGRSEFQFALEPTPIEPVVDYVRFCHC